MALVQSNWKNAGAVTSTTLAFTNAVTTGNCKLAMGYTGSGTGATQSASDNVDGAYSQAILATFTNTVSINYKANATGGAATVTLSSTPGNSQMRLLIAERDDIGQTNPLDQTASAGNTNTTTWNCGTTATTSQTNETVVAVLGDTTGPTVTAGSGYTLDPKGQNKLWAQYQSGVAQGALTAPFSLSAISTGPGAMATFLPAGQPVLNAATGVFTLTGEATTLTFSNGSFSLSAATGTFALVGGAATLAQAGSFVIVANPGAYDLVGGLGTSDDQMDASLGTFSLFGPPNTLSFNGGATFSLNLDLGTFALTGPQTTLSNSLQFTLAGGIGTFGYQGLTITGALTSGSCEAAPAPGVVLNLEIVTDALQKIGIIDETEFPSAEQGMNALRILNDFLLNENADGLRLGWFKQTDLAAIAPLRTEDVWGVKMLLARKLAHSYGVTLQDPNIISDIQEAERQMIKRSILYFESDLTELSRPQGGPWGGPNWL